MRKKSRVIALSAVAIMSLGVSACSNNEPAAPPTPAPQRQAEKPEAQKQQERQAPAAARPEAGQAAAPAGQGQGNAAEEAKQIYSSRCLACHGATGAGDGAAAAALNPKPRSFADKAWQASVTDEQIDTVIVKGGPSIGKSPLMPGNPDLEGKPEVVAELRKMIRAFGK